MNKPPKTAYTLIELVAVLAILGVLLCLFLPAVQRVREASRRTTCLNNLRQVSLASLSFETSHQTLPGPDFNALPGMAGYREDVGLFPSFSVYFEAGAWANPTSTFRLDNQPLLLQSLPILRCPSAPSPERLSGLSERISGDETSLASQTCDYAGNGGSLRKRGSIGVRIRSLVDRVSLAGLTDGTSQTLLFWESIGGQAAISYQLFPLDNYIFDAFSFRVGDTSSEYVIRSSTLASTKSYLHSWGGLRIGNLGNGGTALNCTNLNREIFGMHPRGASVSFADGSVHFLESSMAPFLLVELAGGSDGE